MSIQLEGDAFQEKLEEEAKEAGVEDVVAAIQIESIAVADEVQVATQTNAAVSFQLTVSIPARDMQKVDPGTIQLLVDALNIILPSLACVSAIIVLHDTLTTLTSIAC